MDVTKISPKALGALRARGLDDETLASLTPEEAFSEFCEWNGLMRWADTLIEVLDNLRNAAGQGAAATAEIQAKLDAVMLEYCPDEMTEAQKDAWAANQKAVGKAESEKINRAVTQAIHDDLTESQQSFLLSLPNYVRRAHADILKNKEAVFIERQNEVGDAPPFALCLERDPSYWLDCCETEDAARDLAKKLLLPLVEKNQP